METKWIILIYFFFKFNWIFHCKQPHFTIYFPKQSDIIVFINEDLHYSTYPFALVSACQMMNWPNKCLIWSSKSTLALSIGTLQRNVAQNSDKYTIYVYCQKILISILSENTVSEKIKFMIFRNREKSNPLRSFSVLYHSELQ